MKPTIALSLFLLASPAFAAENADHILRATSAKLAASKNFTFNATREIAPVLREGHDLPGKARVTVAVSRPSQISARAVSRDGTRRFIADGRKLTVADETAGFYAQAPVRATLDRLVESLDALYGFTPPLAEFALSDIYQDLRRQAHTITYLGTGKSGGGFLGLGGIECHRIGLLGKVADAELWIAMGDQLPRKLVATFKLPGNPQVRVDFSSWNLGAPLTAADFTFTPPTGSTKIEMWTKSRMNTARKN